jgi:putative ABC transport system substrate-binding protein
MRRREFLFLLGSAAASWSHAANTPLPSSRPVVVWLAAATQSAILGIIGAFQEGLHELGYTEGRNLDLVFRFADGYMERLPGLAEEVVRLKPAVILAGSVVCTVAVKKLTATIPIVTPTLADAIELGLVASMVRPGGNVTGITPYVSGLPAKQMELARDVVPDARRVGLLGNMNDPKALPQRDELEDVGRQLGVECVVPEVRSPEDLDSAMQALARERVDAVIVLQTTMILSERKHIAALAIAHRLPTICGYREHVDDGGLISYGVDLHWCFRRAATFVHKILQGTPPGELPVEFPTRLEMVVNLQTARALGMTVSPLLLYRADAVIQ